MNKIKPCANCTADARLDPVENPTEEDIKEVDFTGVRWCVKCRACRCRSGFEDTPDKAIEKWNTRPESAWERFGILYNKYGLEKILPALAVMTKCAAPASILLEFIQKNKEQQAINKIKEIEKELKT